MKSTRDRILTTLLRHPHSTISELASEVGINPLSVRHHLTNLQVEGLVVSEEERHGVGRPRLVYFLTEAGSEKFPTRYLRLTSRLLDQLKTSMPAPMVSKLFSQMADEMAEDYTKQLSGLNLEERLELIKKLLVEEGFDFEPPPLPSLSFRQSWVLVTLKICLSAKIIIAHSIKKRWNLCLIH